MKSNTDVTEQEKMEQWFTNIFRPNSSFYRQGIIPMMDPHFVSCDYENMSVTLSFHGMEWQLNPEDIIHGGVLVTAMDTAFGALSHYISKLKMVTTVSINTTFLKPVLVGDELLVTAKAISLGRTLVSLTAEGVLTRTGKRAISSTSTFMILNKEYDFSMVTE